MLNLGILNDALGDHELAIDLSKEVAELCRNAKGIEDLQLLERLQGAAPKLFNAGEASAARAMMEEVVVLRTRVQGSEHPKTLEAARLLAEMDQ